MNPFLWVLWAFIALAILVFGAAVVSYAADEREKRREAAAMREAALLGVENHTVRRAVVQLHRPEVWERRVEGDGQRVTALCTHCTRIVGAPVLYPCDTVQAVREASGRGDA